jgi:phosphorylcholine metabolism protein LicD
MKKEIQTSKGVFTYEPVELYVGRKFLDPVISRENLLDFKTVMDKHNLHYGLWFGTLLGAIRENGFIKHDEDTDIFMLDEDKEKVFDALVDFEEIGLKVIRYQDKGEILSFMRNDDYIDIYFYKKSLNQRVTVDNGIDGKYLESTEMIDFLDTQFPVPNNPKEVVEILYGKDWHIPLEGAKPQNISTIHTIKSTLLKIPVLSTIYKKLKALK